MRSFITNTAKQGVIWVASGILLAIFLLTTSPLNLPLPVLLLPFLFFFIWVRSGVICAAILIKRRPISSRKLRFAATALATISLLVVALQSLGQLSWRDILLILGLSGLLMVYFNRSDLI